MAYTPVQLNNIYDRTNGRCHLCRKKLAFNNYGRAGERAAWEVEHSVCRARGGCDSHQNRFAACIPCNRAKGTRHTRTVRRANGFSSAPRSREQRAASRERAQLLGGGASAYFGYRAFGPWGALFGGLAGAKVFGAHDPDRRHR